ncbi:MAG TPA: hypothetical protein VJ327_07160 [Patescibacteria group bacterium]|nr:hypothetical protein [Patescibacteria group bacterium]
MEVANMDYPELNTLLILGIILLVAVSFGMLALLLRVRLSPTAKAILSIVLIVCLLGAVLLAYFLYRAVTPEVVLPIG